jgi:hypothetical protein
MTRRNRWPGRALVVACILFGLASGCAPDPPLPKPDPDALKKEADELNRQRQRERSKQ